jgi:hypothetical protein
MATQNWMLCFDGSSFAQAAIDWTLDLFKVSKPQHLEVHILSVLQPSSSIAGLAGPFGGAASSIFAKS